MSMRFFARPWLTADRMLHCWPLYPTYARTKNDRQLIFHLHWRDPPQSWPRIGKINTNFRKAFELDVKLARTPRS